MSDEPSSATTRGGEEIFESSPPLPTATNHTEQRVRINPAIETAPINAVAAFEVFQGKLYGPTGTVYFLLS